MCEQVVAWKEIVASKCLPELAATIGVNGRSFRKNVKPSTLDNPIPPR